MSLQEIFWRPSAVTSVLVLLTLLFCRGSVSTPVIKVMSNDSSRVVLQCESAGWYPEPELLWLDGEGNLLSAGPTETLRGPDDLYTVSSRVTVEKRHSNNITCRVQQRNTNQSRETHIHVPGSAVRKEPSATFIIVIIGLLYVGAAIAFVWNFMLSKKPGASHVCFPSLYFLEFQRLNF
uniref:Ig-like domain-containing protein n=1 Tax=Astatotilapia calliptera TaxID=8154 RepID=A0AAX7UJA9_ASTCA